MNHLQHTNQKISANAQYVYAKTYTISLTEAQWRRKEDGVKMRTGHASRMQEVTAMACKTKIRLLQFTTQLAELILTLIISIIWVD